MCIKNVRDWLVMLTMENYLGIFLDHGYSSINRCLKIMLSDLIMLGIDEPSHRSLILDGVLLLQSCPDFITCQEPCNSHVAPNPDQENIPNNFSFFCHEDLETICQIDD